MTVVLFALLAVLAVIAYFAFGYGDPDVSRRCPGCGLQELEIVYPGQVEVRTRFHCRACDAEYREAADGSLEKEG